MVYGPISLGGNIPLLEKNLTLRKGEKFFTVSPLLGTENCYLRVEIGVNLMYRRCGTAAIPCQRVTVKEELEIIAYTYAKIELGV